jgi:multiple sugar transport system permease protein
LLLALLMQRANRLARLFTGTVVITAWIMPVVATAMMWFAFTTSGGTLSAMFSGGNADILDNNAMLIVCLANVWAATGFSLLLFSGALQTVPNEVLEASQLEGASQMRRVRSIVLPIIRPTIVTNILISTIIAIGNFTLIYLLTQGGPENATNILPVYSYTEAFQFNRLAYGALIGDCVVLVGGILAYLYVRANRSRSGAHRV